MGVSGQRHAPAALYPREKYPRYPLYRRLDGPQSRSGHRGYRKNPLPLPEIEPRLPCRPVRSQTIYWLSYPGSSWRDMALYNSHINSCGCVCSAYNYSYELCSKSLQTEFIPQTYRAAQLGSRRSDERNRRYAAYQSDVECFLRLRTCFAQQLSPTRLYC
jgi:hypothetical protein